MQRQAARFSAIASILFWLWGLLVLLVGLAVGYPALVAQRSAIPLLLLCLWGAAFCAGGFALRRWRWGVQWWGSLLCGGSIAALLLAQVRLSPLGVAVNALALGFILASWRVSGREQP